jgi:cell division protein ZapA
MAEVNLLVGGREYRLACRDGEEEDLRAAASLLDARVSNLSENLGSVGEARLLLMAALLVSGELLERKLGQSATALASPAPASPAPAPDRAAFEALARRAEALASRLEDSAAAA